MFSSFLLLFSLTLIGRCPTTAQNKSPNARISFDIGIVLHLESTLGKTNNVCISMALDDFFTTENNYNTKLILHWRDSKEDDVEAASMAVAQSLQRRRFSGSGGAKSGDRWRQTERADVYRTHMNQLPPVRLLCCNKRNQAQTGTFFSRLLSATRNLDSEPRLQSP
ncbi:hypothetical protein MRB53_008946 [Persea americana]|uniref:Uncharacterized protein n=1 Tax=Persea americana TaxID=3435 RepID=A0ACC2LNR2_PERAE|nr:hypothetical protein MRB53_008946 [Persea americana]